MTQLVLNIENPAVLPSLKKLISFIDGVSVAKTTTRKEKKRGIDLALEDVKVGRVNEYSSAEEMFEKLEI